MNETTVNLIDRAIELARDIEFSGRFGGALGMPDADDPDRAALTMLERAGAITIENRGGVLWATHLKSVSPEDLAVI